LIADLITGDKTPEQVEACIERFNADEEPAYHVVIATSYNACACGAAFRFSSPAADMLNLVFDVMAGSLAASVPLPASTLEDVSLATLIWIKSSMRSLIL